MFDLYCHHCDTTYLIGPRRVLSVHNTSDGPVAYARCPLGHVVGADFRRPSADVESAA